MTSINFRVEHPDGSTESIRGISAEVEKEFAKQDLMTARVTRNAINKINLTEREDEVYLVVNEEDRFGGVLRDISRGGSDVALIVGSFEQYAKDAQPTPPADQYGSVDDSTVVTDAIDDVPQLSAGTVDTVQSGLSLLFSHSSQAYKIRQTAAKTTAEVRYNIDKTVDYLSRRGVDKLGSNDPIIRPGSRTLIGDIELNRRSGEERVTHLRVLGSGEGVHQLSTEAVADGYNGGRKIWKTHTDTSVTKQSTLESLAETLIDELNTPFIELEATVANIDPNIGDKYRVVYRKEDIGAELRVVSMKTIIDKEGERYSLTLSNRQKTRGNSESKQLQDISNYNTSIEGTAVPINVAGGRRPVDPSNDYIMEVYYPREVEFEHRLNIRVIGQPYRAYSSGASSGGDHSHSVTVTHPEHRHNINTFSESPPQQPNDDFAYFDSGVKTINDNGNNLQFATLGETSVTDHLPERGFPQLAHGIIRTKNGTEFYPDRLFLNVDVVDPDSNLNAESYVMSISPDTGSYSTDRITGFTAYYGSMKDRPFRMSLFHSGIKNASSMDVEYSFYVSRVPLHKHGVDSTTKQELGSTTSETSDASGDHQHPPDPGLTEFNDFHPEDCDLIINGDSQGLSLGDGNGGFSESIDVRGKLDSGTLNTIKLSSNQLGHVTMYLEGDVYRQIKGDG